MYLKILACSQVSDRFPLGYLFLMHEHKYKFHAIRIIISQILIRFKAGDG